MMTDPREDTARNEKLFEFTKTATGYSHFCMLCALEGFEPWSPSMYNVCAGCIQNKNDGFDIWKAMAE